MLPAVDAAVDTALSGEAGVQTVASFGDGPGTVTAHHAPRVQASECAGTPKAHNISAPAATNKVRGRSRLSPLMTVPEAGAAGKDGGHCGSGTVAPQLLLRLEGLGRKLEAAEALMHNA